MKITIKPEVFQKIDPQFRVGFILASGIDNKSKATKVDHLLTEMQKAVLLSFNKDTVKTHHLISPWNSAKDGIILYAQCYKEILKMETIIEGFLPIILIILRILISLVNYKTHV